MCANCVNTKYIYNYLILGKNEVHFMHVTLFCKTVTVNLLHIKRRFFSKEKRKFIVLNIISNCQMESMKIVVPTNCEENTYISCSYRYSDSIFLNKNLIRVYVTLSLKNHYFLEFLLQPIARCCVKPVFHLVIFFA